MQQFREPPAAHRRARIRMLVGYVVAISATSLIVFLVPGTTGFMAWLALVPAAIP